MFRNFVHTIDDPENPKKHLTLVCVTGQFQCERLIKAGRVVADLSNTGLNVLHIARPSSAEVPVEGRVLQHLFEVSKQNDAVMTIYCNDNVLRCLTQYIRENRVVNVITGMPQQENSPLEKLWHKFGQKQVSFFTVSKVGELHPVDLKKHESYISYLDPEKSSVPTEVPSLFPAP